MMVARCLLKLMDDWKNIIILKSYKLFFSSFKTITVPSLFKLVQDNLYGSLANVKQQNYNT